MFSPRFLLLALAATAVISTASKSADVIVSKCCPAGTMVNTETHRCVLSHIHWSPPFYNQDLEQVDMPVDNYVLKPGFPTCSEGMFVLDPHTYLDDRFYLLSNGRLLFPRDKSAFNPGQYCVENFVDLTGNTTFHAILCFPEQKPTFEGGCGTVVYSEATNTWTYSNPSWPASDSTTSYSGDCTWSLGTSLGSRIQIWAEDLALDCCCNFVGIYDGWNTSRLIGRFCDRTEWMTPIVSSGNRMTVLMVTDSVVTPISFRIHFKSLGGSSSPEVTVACEMTRWDVKQVSPCLVTDRQGYVVDIPTL